MTIGPVVCKCQIRYSIVLSTYMKIFTPDTLYAKTKGYDIVQIVLQPVCSNVQTIPSKT